VTVSGTRAANPASSSLREFRRDLHHHPELRFQEFRTGERVAERLRLAGLDVTTGHAVTGVVARLDSGVPGPHILVRADMDALPTQDLKTVPYASTNAQVAHACGHDVHTTVVVGVAEEMAGRSDLRGRLTFVFQPAEEIPFGEPSGGQAMIDAGVLDGVDIVLGLHCWPDLLAGTIGVDRSIAMAAKKAFRIAIRGTGAHAATPSKGRDAVLAASMVINALNQLIGREVDPGGRVALNVGTVSGGQSQSIVAPAAELTGTIRTVQPELADRLHLAVERVVAGVAVSYGVEAVVEWKNEMPAVLNDARLVERAQEVFEADPVIRHEVIEQPPMTADDFALYAQQRPGLYVKLGVRAADDSSGIHPLHDGRFDVDEGAIDTGVRGLAALVTDLMNRGWEGRLP
jgi:amidohydrolase